MSTQTSNYRDIKAISNSLMSVYEDNYQDFVNYWVKNIPLPQKKDDALTMGSLIDTIITNPNEFKERFIIFNEEAPTGQILQFCTKLANKYREGCDITTLYQGAYDEVGFKRDTLSKVVERFDQYKPFFEFLVNRKDKDVITKEQFDKATQIAQELMHGKYTKNIINARTIKNDEEDIEVFNQLEIQDLFIGVNDESVAIKGALDKVIVDHKRKVILIADLKSTYSVSNFPNSYEKWRYFRQGSFYTHLVKLWAFWKSYKDYTIKPFTFIVCSTTFGKHYLYQMSTNDIKQAQFGGYLITGEYVKGWDQILNEITHMQKLGNWDYPYEAVVNNGVISLNIFRYEQQ